MPYPITTNLLLQLTGQQRAAYDRAKKQEHPHLPSIAVDRVSDAKRYYRNGYGRVPEHTSEIRIKDEFGDGTTYTRVVIVIPRQKPLADSGVER